MNLRNHVRRNVAVAVAAIAVALGAAGGAQADTAVAHESVATDLPSATASAPTAPRSPTATAGNARVKLAWLAPSSNGGATINKYRVQRATSAAGPWTRIATPTARSHTARGLSNGTRYHFRIAAHNAAGWGPYSTVVNTVPRTVPSAVPACSATQGGGGGASSPTMSIVWQHPLSDGGAPIEYFYLEFWKNDVLLLDWYLPPDSHVFHRDVSPGYYRVRVAAGNAAGLGQSCTDDVIMFS